MRRRALPFFERWVVNWFGSLPLLNASRPADFGSLLAGISYGVIGNCVEAAFLLGEGEDVIINPIFQAEMKRRRLDCFGCEGFLRFEKSGASGVENFSQPIRHAVCDFEDRADPQVEFLPVDVLIASVVKPLPRDAAGLIVGALARSPLKSDGRVAHGFAFEFLQARVPRKGDAGPPVVDSRVGAHCRTSLINLSSALRATICQV